jgi:hypothetical protein
MKTGGTVSEEEYYCIAWCYILDKNFAFKMGRFETLLDIEIGHFTSDQSSHQHSTSDLFQIYMSLAGVQAAVLPYLTWHSSMLAGDLSSSHGMGKHWLVNMQQIQGRIEEVREILRYVFTRITDTLFRSLARIRRGKG